MFPFWRLGFLLVFSFGFSAWAQTTGTTGISTTTVLVGYSNYFNKSVTVSGNEVTVFAGNTETACLSSNSGEPCNSCAALATTPIASATATDLVCNQRQIHPDLFFTVTLRNPNITAYPACPTALIAMKVSGATAALTAPFAGTQSAYTPGVANQNISASFKWSQICSLIGAGVGCSNSVAPTTLEFGFNSTCSNSTLVDIGLRLNLRFRHVARTLGFMTFPCDDVLLPGPYEGICSFTTYRGDGKVYFLDIGAPFGSTTTLPVPDSSGTLGVTADLSGMVYDKLRIFCKPTSGPLHTSITTNDVCGDLQIEGTKLNDAKIEGLTNGVEYEFLAANVDEAGNVSYFSNPTAVGTFGVATPAEVFGLLDQQKCFIATAAFGTPFEPHVATLRKFRDDYLMTWPWGRRFVEFYYDQSQDWARWIAENEGRRAMARLTLFPFVFLAELILQWGLWIFALPLVIPILYVALKKWVYAR